MGIASPYLRGDMIALTLGNAHVWDRDDRARTWSLSPHGRRETCGALADRTDAVHTGVNVLVESCDPQLGRGFMRTGGHP